jgi:RNA polymerase-binding transcription factor DksA
MTSGVRTESLTPLERLQLRDALQDRWREQVRQITLLSLAWYDADGADPATSAAAPIDSSALEWAIRRARERLEGLEQAMRRLDEGNYGLCSDCRGPIGFGRLSLVPDEGFCDRCRMKPSGPVFLDTCVTGG